MHNLVQNQPDLAAVNQAQSLKHKALGPGSLLSTWAYVLFYPKKKKKKKRTHTVNSLLLHRWMQVTLISSHYLIKSNLLILH